MWILKQDMVQYRKGGIFIKPKLMCKMVIDLIMTVLLLLLMAYHLTGDAAHEWIGAGMFALFFAHNLLNLKWYSGLFKGKYTPYRVIQTAVNLLVLLSMLGQIVSGILLSQHIFTFLPVSGHASFARKLHLLGAYWGFLLMSLHLGLHWNMVMGMTRKTVKITAPSSVRRILLRLTALLIAGYGAAAFLKYDLISYMLLKNQFAFFDYEQPALSFFSDYLAMMGLWILIAHSIGKLARTFAAAPSRTP